MTSHTSTHSEVATTQETKPGYLTTEFWLVIVANVLSQTGALQFPDKYKSYVLLASLVGYSISRGLAKLNIPDVVPARASRSRKGR